MASDARDIGRTKQNLVDLVAIDRHVRRTSRTRLERGATRSSARTHGGGPRCRLSPGLPGSYTVRDHTRQFVIRHRQTDRYGANLIVSINYRICRCADVRADSARPRFFWIFPFQG